MNDWVLWGSELSPFALKVAAMLTFEGLPFRWMPAQGGFREALRYEARVRALRKGRLPLTWPRQDPLDELPLVPFLFGADGQRLYDSSAIGAWLGTREAPRARGRSLLPTGDAALRFAVHLVDEALDEVGLYLVHHNRWVVSARDNDAGVRLARELRVLLGPLAPLLGRRFAARQVRRLPYLFSVAPEGDDAFEDLPARLRPPARAGFPGTHALLEEAFRELLAVLEPVLAARPYLFGERFTLADASVYGQLAMNCADPSAAAWIARAAPAVWAWLAAITRGNFSRHRDDGPLFLDDALRPLLRWICRTFVPLMQQNHDAFQRHRGADLQRFNEAAFDAGVALYDGQLRGRPFRAVVKSFQVRVWRDLRRGWEALAPGDRAAIAALLPEDAGLDRDGAAPSPEAAAGLL